MKVKKKKYCAPTVSKIPKVEDVGRLSCKQSNEINKKSTNILSAASHCHYQCSPRCA